MFARGAIINPNIFSEFRQKLLAPVTEKPALREEIHALIREHAELLRTIFAGKVSRRGDDYALNRVRIVAPRYCRQLSHAASLRTALSQCLSWDDLYRKLEIFFYEE